MKDKLIYKKQSFYLFIYDLVILGFSCFLILYMYLHIKNKYFTSSQMWFQIVLLSIVLFICRYSFNIYKQVWRYGDVQSYLRLMISDGVATVVFYFIERIFPIKGILFTDTISIFSINLLICLAIRIAYRYCYKYSNSNTKLGKILSGALTFFSFGEVIPNDNANSNAIPIAILGAGNIGVDLANSFLDNNNSVYQPNLFLEINKEKIGRSINNIPIFSEECGKNIFDKYGIQEVVFTVDVPPERKQQLYQRYKEFGLRIKTYDYPIVQTENSKKYLREFDIEELLFRKQLLVVDEKTRKYYKNKIVLITGGGGSIGSEMARQVAKMEPKKLILLDIYENGVYDVQQELVFTYKEKLDINVEICNILDNKALEKVFYIYKPNIVIHAAAHKHVPLMEHNVIEAIYNNVFGTLNAVKLSEKYKVQRFIMVSTDKAVNPTNVMGATKRMCEMIVKAYSNKESSTTYSMTRFGNVLGSAGSVIPLFKRQIKAGGPLTITDKRIIRYFMTIPEASQLVLKSGAMAKNGELFVLDMGKPVKILDLAENLIRLSGFEPYKDIDILEIGLRLGEKLYEELLVKSETLTKTSDSLIFIEDDKPLTIKELNKNLSMLEKAIDDKDDVKAKEVLKKTVPTFKDPEEVNNIVKK